MTISTEIETQRSDMATFKGCRRRSSSLTAFRGPNFFEKNLNFPAIFPAPTNSI